MVPSKLHSYVFSDFKFAGFYLLLRHRLSSGTLGKIACAWIRHITYYLNSFSRAAATAPWLLQSCGPRIESQTHHLCFFSLHYWNCNWYWNKKRTKINEKEASIGHNFKTIAVFLWRTSAQLQWQKFDTANGPPRLSISHQRAVSA